MSQGQEMNAERAREKVARFTKGCGSGCGKCVTLNEYHEAKGYLMALEQGPEVRAIVKAAERVHKTLGLLPGRVDDNDGGTHDLYGHYEQVGEALSTFQKAVGK